MIASTTYEEAPAKLGPWLRQRTRWFKGWMQTWLVHMRQPRRLAADLGLLGFVSFQLIVGGNALAALVHPLFLGSFIYSVASGAPMWRDDSLAVVVLATLYGTSVVIGYLTSAFLGWLGLMRRGLLSTAWVLLLTPLHWLLLSLAAWRALYQLIVAPYAWEKTEHGLAKNSRLNAAMTRSLLELERHLTDLEHPAACRRSRVGLEKLFQIGSGFLGSPLKAEGRDEAALLVHQINQRGMVHAVVAIACRHFLGKDVIDLLGRLDRLAIAGGAAQMRIEARQIILHHRRRVALGIDRDEQRMHAGGVRAHGVQHFRQVEQRRRADIGAMRIAEEHQERLALHVLVGDRLAVLVGEMERAADRRAARAHRF